MSGDTGPEVYNFYVRAPVLTGIQPLTSIIEEQRRFMFVFNDECLTRKMEFYGAVKKVEAITGNIAKISVEVLSEIGFKILQGGELFINKIYLIYLIYNIYKSYIL